MIEEWRQKLLDDPPAWIRVYPPEEQRHIILVELKQCIPFHGEHNGMYGRRYNHTAETKRKIKKNNVRYWKGKTGHEHHATGKSRPDSVETARRMGLANRGKRAWNKGQTGVYTQTDETRRKISMANRKPKPRVVCPHCQKEGGIPQLMRWHFDNCRSK